MSLAEVSLNEKLEDSIYIKSSFFAPLVLTDFILTNLGFVCLSSWEKTLLIASYLTLALTLLNFPAAYSSYESATKGDSSVVNFFS